MGQRWAASPLLTETGDPPDRLTPALAEEWGLILVRLPHGSTLPGLLGAALARATGEIIAIADATCGIDDGWIAAILKAHEAPYPIVGGAVEPGDLRSLVDWAAYFCDYGRFMRPLSEGRVNELPGSNLSLKRRVLAKEREFVEPEFWKTLWCRRLQCEGIPLSSAPSMVVSYNRSYRLWPYLVRRFHHGRCFAGMRRAQLSGTRRALYLAGSPLLPVLLAWRFLKALLPKRRHRRRLLLSFPVTFLALVSWALGEFCGYLGGPGQSCRYVR